MGNAPTTTDDGFEIQFGTNYIGHFLLTRLLLPTLRRTATATTSASQEQPDVRIITVSSSGSAMAPSSLADMTSTPSLLESSTWTRYGASKAANILFAAELARRFPEILSVSVHPGVVASSLYETAMAHYRVAKYGAKVASLFVRNVRSGAMNQVWAAGTRRREDLVNGAFYTPIGNLARRNQFSGDEEMARKLWDWTEEVVVEKLGR